MLTSSGCPIDSSKTIGSFPAVLNFNRLFLDRYRFIWKLTAGSPWSLVESPVCSSPPGLHVDIFPVFFIASRYIIILYVPQKWWVIVSGVLNLNRLFLKLNRFLCNLVVGSPCSVPFCSVPFSGVSNEWMATRRKSIRCRRSTWGGPSLIHQHQSHFSWVPVCDGREIDFMAERRKELHPKLRNMNPPPLLYHSLSNIPKP